MKSVLTIRNKEVPNLNSELAIPFQLIPRTPFTVTFNFNLVNSKPSVLLFLIAISFL